MLPCTWCYLFGFLIILGFMCFIERMGGWNVIFNDVLSRWRIFNLYFTYDAHWRMSNSSVRGAFPHMV